MNEYQLRAIKHHCRLAGETCNPRWGHVHRNGLSVVLTVNSGYE